MSNIDDLALNAELNHWPPHLGVTTDAEKIEYLAQRLAEQADVATDRDEIASEVEGLEEEKYGLELGVDELKDEVEELKESLVDRDRQIELLTAENRELEAQLASK
jgi:predicted RNase H-like nuclease (RuvC/YqgF family)